jgi:Phasin protein/Cornifin (SPRR) family
MSAPNQNKPGGKKHSKKSRKPDQPQNQKPEQLLSAKPERVQSKPPEPLQTKQPEPLQSKKLEPPQTKQAEPLQSKSPEPLQTKPPEPLQSKPPEPLQTKPPEPLQESKKQVDAALEAANCLSVDFQTLATAYGNYTKKSFEETKAFVEKLSGVRSLEKAVEIQTEFAKQAYETFVTESQKIRDLYSGLAKQSLKPFEGLGAKKNQPPR